MLKLEFMSQGCSKYGILDVEKFISQTQPYFNPHEKGLRLRVSKRQESHNLLCREYLAFSLGETLGEMVEIKPPTWMALEGLFFVFWLGLVLTNIFKKWQILTAFWNSWTRHPPPRFWVLVVGVSRCLVIQAPKNLQHAVGTTSYLGIWEHNFEC
jgi:hypothetical protein